MVNFVVILLLVLFPPPEVAATQPDAKPVIVSIQVSDVEKCKALGPKVLAAEESKFHGSTGMTACLVIPAPTVAKAKPGLQKDGSILMPNGDIIKPYYHI